MVPIQAFAAVWQRCAELETLHAYIKQNTTPAISGDELLRAEWAMRVGALDLYIHELVCQRLVDVFEGRRTSTPAYLRYEVSLETVNRIRAAATVTDARAAFDLEMRATLGRDSFQHPEKIAEAIRLVSPAELWNEVALRLGADEGNKNAFAKEIKRDLALIVDRRNIIVHEGDLQPGLPRIPWPISRADLAVVKERIGAIVDAIDSILV